MCLNRFFHCAAHRLQPGIVSNTSLKNFFEPLLLQGGGGGGGGGGILKLLRKTGG